MCTRACTHTLTHTHTHIRTEQQTLWIYLRLETQIGLRDWSGVPGSGVHSVTGGARTDAGYVRKESGYQANLG